MLGLLSAALLTAGCTQEPAKTPNEDKPAESAGEEKASAAADDEETAIAAEIAKLPEAEQAAAIAQKYCPVSVMDGGDNRLGSMGMPFKVTLEGQDVYLCCEGCQELAEKEPAKTLATVEDVKKRAAEEK
jgi:hypothetical protein